MNKTKLNRSQQRLIEQLFDEYPDPMKLAWRSSRNVIRKLWNDCYLDDDEIRSVVHEGIIKAARCYRIEKGIKFSTYAGVCIKSKLTDRYRKHFQLQQIHERSFVKVSPNSIQLFGSVEIVIDRQRQERQAETNERDRSQRLIDIALPHLSREHRRMIECKYGLGFRKPLTYAEYAKTYGIAEENARLRHKKVLKKLAFAILAHGRDA